MIGFITITKFAKHIIGDQVIVAYDGKESIIIIFYFIQIYNYYVQASSNFCVQNTKTFQQSLVFIMLVAIRKNNEKQIYRTHVPTAISIFYMLFNNGYMNCGCPNCNY